MHAKDRIEWVRILIRASGTIDTDKGIKAPIPGYRKSGTDHGASVQGLLRAAATLRLSARKASASVRPRPRGVFSHPYQAFHKRGRGPLGFGGCVHAGSSRPPHLTVCIRYAVQGRAFASLARRTCSSMKVRDAKDQTLRRRPHRRHVASQGRSDIEYGCWEGRVQWANTRGAQSRHNSTTSARASRSIGMRPAGAVPRGFSRLRAVIFPYPGLSGPDLFCLALGRGFQGPVPARGRKGGQVKGLSR